MTAGCRCCHRYILPFYPIRLQKVSPQQHQEHRYIVPQYIKLKHGIPYNDTLKHVIAVLSEITKLYLSNLIDETCFIYLKELIQLYKMLPVL